ncbi:bifunctional diaminohydroxyphosphoribosylaminopyrimidine deaminase/5-amino-6-(5-phosphoribosylamino)uracil reductase RibD [Sediminibacterium ginsengisoli]|uniref:Riboflavin biosynthesis protein RibD n=1 Tax=Sediminibacterium ginsengisoli TaxID=413434 RepID=A0A1T4KXI9_9BACT|nr:bifunctional diaminohydroxyphosphoribosylaminopyrimidine deaminase/5-amino-6-(5-phosphoribosylamino)uracil reductase RibD [Sediminibacterium ginsengisoli]SJZ47136.1 diaminohydroxyphosphoribosylaminopyrimidine deaminase [Sediminibacterium ginsengisoli]
MSGVSEKYMYRCIDLALLGKGFVAPNPMVGAVLVHGDRIIGEGWHRVYGGPHAEVDCINSVADADRALIPQSVLYVSLEPCAHYGKTPPCSDLIIRNRIPVVVIGCRDPFAQVDGKGIEKLQKAGIEVICGMLEGKCIALNQRFFTFHLKQRPYIILKWAQTADGYMAGTETDRLLISNSLTNRIVHRWRSEEAAILVGSRTAELDDPALTNRYAAGNSPVRMVLDRQLKLPASLKLFNREQRTIVLNNLVEREETGLSYYRLKPAPGIVEQIAEACCQLQLTSLIVEGGSTLLQQFIKQGIWDEARIITNEQLVIGKGLKAPQLTDAWLESEEKSLSDRIRCYRPAEQKQNRP